MKLECFLTDFRNKAQITNFIKIHLEGADLFYADVRRMHWDTDSHDEASSRFSQICERA
jgi:hypothetical protein